jgi:hypothetical protein
MATPLLGKVVESSNHRITKSVMDRRVTRSGCFETSERLALTDSILSSGIRSTDVDVSGDRHEKFELVDYVFTQLKTTTKEVDS